MLRFFRSFAAIFKPPFDGLALVVVLYFAWAHMVYPHNDVMRGNLPDPDDYMYLTQVLDWLKGQGWYDNVQHRLNPPAGVPIHFSRLAQMPLAAGIWFFEKLGLPARGAATLTALIEPLVLLGGCLWFLRKASAFVVPRRWAGASAYVACFSVGLLYEFMPGHVDHHGLVIVLLLASICCILRMMEEPESYRPGITAGLILAATMMIALECLPWVLLLSAWLGLWSMRLGGRATHSGAIFGVSLLAGSAVCLALTRSPETWAEIDVLTYSVVYVVLAAFIAVPFIGVAAVDRIAPVSLRRGMRWAIGLGLAVAGATVFLHRFPDLIAGPYGGIDPQLTRLLLEEVEEAKPILKTDHGWQHALDFLTMGFIALAAGLIFAWRARGAESWKWGLLTMLLAAALGLTIFYQYRFLGMEAALAVIPLTGLLQRGWQWVGRALAGRQKFYAQIGLLLLVGPLPAVIGPALFDGRSFNTGVLLFPVDSGHSLCDMAQLEHVLRDPKGLGDRPRLIASFMELGPELLFRTDHSVLAAPFHMNVQGNLDAARFFSSPYASESKSIAERRQIDLVVMCRSVPEVYLGAKDEAPSLTENLFAGTGPDWLEREDVKEHDNFVIYRVKR